MYGWNNSLADVAAMDPSETVAEIQEFGWVVRTPAPEVKTDADVIARALSLNSSRAVPGRRITSFEVSKHAEMLKRELDEKTGKYIWKAKLRWGITAKGVETQFGVSNDGKGRPNTRFRAGLDVEGGHSPESGQRMALPG